MLKLLRVLLRSVVHARLSGVVGFVVLFFVSPYSGTVERKKAKATILAMNSQRFRGDLDFLSESGYRILILRWPFQTAIAKLFWPYDLGQSYCEIVLFEDSAWEIRKKKTRTLIRQFVPWLSRFHKVDCIVGAALHYRFDVDWGGAFEEAGIPYIVLHRENMSVASEKRRREKIKTWGGYVPFEGSLLAVHSKVMAETLVESGYIDDKRVKALGSIRHDRLARLIAENKGKVPEGKPLVTLFSFTFSPDLGLCKHFEYGCHPSFEELFMSVHGRIAEMAISEPGVDFLVKSKWSGVWREAFYKALSDRGIWHDDVPNLTFSDEGDVNDIILNSLCVIALNSTTALESAVLGRPVIRPYYSDAGESASDYMLFIGEDDGFVYAESEGDLEWHVKSMIACAELWEEVRTEKSRGMFERYVSPLDGCCPSRYSECIEDVALDRH